ncbi:unnamed protein product [Rhizoctonia solani]|uniref:Uncharacterized protein n=1 Tax=Rhizoctonia solani TaxID=456999 RepID=A0A8H3AIE3_9AGAM|nr:unnamed protein product [Rhizoctonia solani]
MTKVLGFIVLVLQTFNLGLHDFRFFTQSLNMAWMVPSLEAQKNNVTKPYIFKSVKHSLERLQIDYMSMYSSVTASTIAETMQVLHDVVQTGYAPYTGMPSCYTYQFHAMQICDFVQAYSVHLYAEPL